MNHDKTLAVLLIVCVAVCAGASKGSCKYKYNPHKAVQADQTGRRCWDTIKIRTCAGYCLSYELPHWQFPYKESHHPVCVHDDRRHKSVKLRFCDPGVEQGTDMYHYVEAASCKCQVCSSEDTSCEWLPPDTSLIEGLFTQDEILEEEIE